MAGIAAVITASDSVAAGTNCDASGPQAAAILAAQFGPVAITVVADDAVRITDTLRDLISSGVRVAVVTGGTGIGPRDVTPEAIRALGGREIPGIAEAIRSASRVGVPAADLSRTLAVATDRCIVLGVPGSPGGVRDALGVALPLLEHALAMLDGGRHGHTADVQARTSLVRSTPISVAECESVLTDHRGGAVVSFTGIVRNHDQGRPVIALTYEAHPGAHEALEVVLAEARALPGVLGAAALHRVGDLGIGEVAFAAAVSAPHRREAFSACAWLVDEVKSRVPIWKKQQFADGPDEWVNSP